MKNANRCLKANKDIIRDSLNHINPEDAPSKVRTLLWEDPDFIDDMITGVVSNIDNKVFEQASMCIVNAVIDRVSGVKLFWYFISHRIRHKLDELVKSKTDG